VDAAREERKMVTVIALGVLGIVKRQKPYPKI
jgi:hypothetical protein